MATKRHRVVSVLVDGMTAFEPSVADEFFGGDRTDLLGVPWYRYTTCTPGSATVRIGSFHVRVPRGRGQPPTQGGAGGWGGGGGRPRGYPRLGRVRRGRRRRAPRRLARCAR